MAYQKLIGQGTRMLVVIPSDNNNIPYPGHLITSSATTSATGVSDLNDTGAEFLRWGVEPGWIVYNRSTLGAGVVDVVSSDTALRVGAGLTFAAPAQVYELYSPEILAARLWTATTPRTLKVTTAGKDDVEFGFQAGAPTPGHYNPYEGSQVIKVWATGTFGGAAAPDLLAVW